MVIEVDREQVVAYRVRAQGLDRAAPPTGGPAVLDLGVQGSAGLAARLALAARAPDSGRGSRAAATELALAWTHRGGPHAHRPADLPRLATALWPVSEADALARMSWRRATLAEVGMDAIEVVATVAASVRSVVTSPMTKPAASTAISADLPPKLVRWCEPCGVHHVPESLLRLAALPAGVVLEPDTYPALLVPLADQPPIPDANAGTTDVVRAYLRLLGPATRADVAGFLGTTATVVKSVWPDDVVEVSVEGRAAWLAADAADALAAAPEPSLTRLLPPSDPWVQGRDRELIVPDPAARPKVWRSIQMPGTVLVDGEIVGTWRAKATGGTLAITVSPFGRLRVTDALAAEAERVAAVRGHADVTVTVS